MLLLFRVSLIASFRAALVVLAVVEVLGFGAAFGSRAVGVREVVTLALKLIVLGGAYLALSS